MPIEASSQWKTAENEESADQADSADSTSSEGIQLVKNKTEISCVSGVKSSG